MKSSSGKYFFQGGENGTVFEAAGTVFRYRIHSTISGDKEELLATGPTDSPLIIQVGGVIRLQLSRH